MTHKFISSFLAAAAAALLSAAQAKAPIPAETMFRDDRVARVSMSPDGEQIAVLLNGYGDAVDEVRIIDLETLSVSKTIGLGDFEGFNIRWANPKRLILTVNVMDTYKDAKDGRFTKVEFVAGRRALSLDTETGVPTIMFGGEDGFVQRNRNLGTIVSTLSKDPDHVIMPAWNSRGYHLWRVNVNTGDAEISERGTDSTVLWYTDQNGEGVIRMDASSSFRTLYVYGKMPDGEWRRLRKVRIDDERDDQLSDFRPVAPGPSEGLYYVLSYPEDEEFRTVKLYDITTDSFVETVYAAEDTDVEGVVLDSETGDLLGIETFRDRRETVMFDEARQAHISGLDKYFKNDANFSVIGGSKDGQYTVIYVSSPTNPGDYYIYDVENSNLQYLFPELEDINPADLGTMTIDSLFPVTLHS